MHCVGARMLWGPFLRVTMADCILLFWRQFFKRWVLVFIVHVFVRSFSVSNVGVRVTGLVSRTCRPAKKTLWPPSCDYRAPTGHFLNMALNFYLADTLSLGGCLCSPFLLKRSLDVNSSIGLLRWIDRCFACLLILVQVLQLSSTLCHCYYAPFSWLLLLPG